MLESLLGLKSQTKILHWSILHLRFISNLGKNICSKNYTQITSMGYKQQNLINNKLTIWLLDNSWIITKAFQLFYALCFVWKLTFTLQSKLTKLCSNTYYTLNTIEIRYIVLPKLDSWWWFHLLKYLLLKKLRLML